MRVGDEDLGDTDVIAYLHRTSAGVLTETIRPLALILLEPSQGVVPLAGMNSLEPGGFGLRSRELGHPLPAVNPGIHLRRSISGPSPVVVCLFRLTTDYQPSWGEA